MSARADEVEAIASLLESHGNIADRPGQHDELHALAARVRALPDDTASVHTAFVAGWLESEEWNGGEARIEPHHVRGCAQQQADSYLRRGRTGAAA